MNTLKLIETLSDITIFLENKKKRLPHQHETDYSVQ